MKLPMAMYLVHGRASLFGIWP